MAPSQSGFESRKKWSWGDIMKEVLSIALLTTCSERCLENLEKDRMEKVRRYPQNWGLSSSLLQSSFQT